jgi:serine-aspartate repeat-containing protein C/D/E
MIWFPVKYCVLFANPVGFEFVLPNQGNDPARDSNADPQTGYITSCVNLGPGEVNTTIDAGLFRRAALGDFVWNDLNRNGIQDAGEPGIHGVKVELFECGPDGSCGTPDDISRGTTTTDASGYYLFDKLLPAKYCVKFTAPENFIFTIKNASGSTSENDSNAGSTGMTDCINLKSNETNLTIDAGLFQLPASLGDFIWEDLNGNGIQDGGEPGIAGVTVKLFTCDDQGNCGNPNNLTATATTDSDGRYLFPDLIPGVSYCVQFVKPAGYEFTPWNQGGDDAIDSDADPADGRTQCVILGPNESNLTIDAGLFRRAGLGDFVWEDLNGNGIQDAGEPGIADVTVKLFTCDEDGVCGKDENFVATTKTDENGFYLFTGLLPDTYCVKFDAPDGFSFTKQFFGNDTAKDSNSDEEGFTGCTALQSGETDRSIDAGLVGCTLEVEKFCSVPVVPEPFVCSDAKPLDSLTMVWGGAKSIEQHCCLQGQI